MFDILDGISPNESLFHAKDLKNVLKTSKKASTGMLWTNLIFSQIANRSECEVWCPLELSRFQESENTVQDKKKAY